MKPTVCLNMIVKNEAHVIERCVRSVLPLIDTWVIVDTGSTDGTQEIVRKVLADVPGELFERPWRDFGHNRSEAITLAKDRADYLLFIDADDTLEVPEDYTLPPLDAGAYQLHFTHGATGYYRTCLVRTSDPWRFEGVLHEYPTCGYEVPTERLEGPEIVYHGDGARSGPGGRAKFLSDAEVLVEALKKEPNNARYVFYLAQSYRDAGELDKALRNYQKRIALGGWDEEVWYSRLEVALLSERLKASDAVVVDAFLAAYADRPTRAEPLVHLARFYRENGKRYALAHLFASRAIEIPRPPDILFVDESAYTWRGQDEYSIACYWTGRYEESMNACKALLASDALPEEQRSRVVENLNFSLQKLG